MFQELDDQEGFHPQCLEVHELSKTKETVYNYTQSKAKELVPTSRPKVTVPRVYKSTVPMRKLPSQLNRQSYSIESLSNSIDLNKQGPQFPKKIKFNGNGRLLTEIFQKPEYTCIYDKSQDEDRSEDEPTTRKRRLGSPYDHNSKTFTQLQSPKKDKPTTLSFDSSFECGNLSQVYKNVSDQYYLLLESDTNTRGYTEWFFFSVSNLPASAVSFHLVNLNKRSSMYTKGFQVSVWTENRGWHKAGDNIMYYNSKIKRKYRPDEYYYCLSFDYTANNPNSIIYFALNQPYSFSRLIGFIDGIQQRNLSPSISVVQKTIGFTHSNNPMLALQIKMKKSLPKVQRIVLVLARQHPGETVSSFVCQGLVSELLSQNLQSNFLLKRYTFVILPMTNPDGVIYGHSRCNLAGLDINRQWGELALKQLNPQTYYIWKFIRELESNAEIVFCLDLHGHSKKTGCFLYGCRLENSSQTKLFAGILSRLERTFVNASCRYGQQSDKQNTIRCQLYKQLEKNCFTLETSFFGWKDKGKIEQYNESTLKYIGKSLVKGVFIAFAPEEIAYKLEGTSSNRIRSTMVSLSERFHDIESASENSESEPDADNLPEKQQLQVLGIPESQVNQLAFVVKINQNIQKPSNTLKLHILKRKKRISTVPSTLVDSEKSAPSNVQPLTTVKPQSRMRKRSSDLFLTRNKNIAALRTGIPKLRLTLVVNSKHNDREKFNSLQIVRREKQLISADRLDFETRSRQTFQKEFSNYINYKLYKRRLNVSLSSQTKSRKISTTEQTSQFLRTLNHLTPTKVKVQPSRKGLYDFPIF